VTAIPGNTFRHTQSLKRLRARLDRQTDAEARQAVAEHSQSTAPYSFLADSGPAAAALSNNASSAGADMAKLREMARHSKTRPMKACQKLWSLVPIYIQLEQWTESRYAADQTRFARCFNRRRRSECDVIPILQLSM